MDGRVGPRTGTSERMVLDHCTGTRRVVFVVGNVCSNRFCRIWPLVRVRSSDDIVTSGVGHDTVVVPVWCQEDLRCVFLTTLTHGRLFVPDTILGRLWMVFFWTGRGWKSGMITWTRSRRPGVKEQNVEDSFYSRFHNTLKIIQWT
jgi:hypothetical protein